MLETIRKAVRLGLLKNDLKSPVAMTIIEDYLKVLKTAYVFTISVHLQRNNVSISGTLCFKDH